MTTTGLILTPGASATRDHVSLVSIDEAVAPTGVRVERIDLLSSSAKAEKHIAVIEAAAEDLGVDRLFLGGRSMGGRMCSLAVAGGLAAAGLVLVSYPLHPPGKRDQLRTAHFPDLDVPCLFVSGTKDSFGTRDELEAATAAIPGDVAHVWIEGGDHGLRRRDAQVAEILRDWIVATR